MNKIVFIVAQVVVALAIFTALNYGGTFFLQQDGVISDPTRSVAKNVFAGWIDASSFVGKSFNTHNQFAKNYVDLPHSVNKMGGAQFTYTMWIKLSDVSAQNTANKVLFIQGDANQYAYQATASPTAGFDAEKVDKNNVGYVVKCPVVRFGDSADNLIVEFNTSTDFNAHVELNRVPSQDLSVRHNVFSLMPGNWALMTFIFEDDKRYNEHEDGVKFTFYLNSTLYHTERVRGALRLNKGDLTILPSGGIQGGYLSDLTYYNYALNVEQIGAIVSKGITNTPFTTLNTDPSFNQTLALSQYNSLEINNA